MTKSKQLESGKVEEKPINNQAVVLSLLEDAEEGRRKVEEYAKTLEERVKKRTFELGVLYELSRKIDYVLNYEELFGLICSSLTKVMDCPISASLLFRENRAKLIISLTRPIEDSIIQNFKKLLLAAFEKTSGQQIKEAWVKTRFIKNESFNAHAPRLKGKIKSFLNAPLIINNKVRGTLNISSLEGNAFTEENIRLFHTVANHTSTCIGKLESLRQAEANKLRSMVESMSEGVIMVNGDGRVAVVNPAAKELLGLKEEDHPENNNLTELLKGSDLAKLSKDGLLESGNGRTRRQIRITKPRERALDTIISAIKDAQGTVIGKAIVLHDITKFKKIDEMKSEFIATASHELRTPLTSMKGAASLLLSEAGGKINRTQKKFLHILNNNCNRLTQLLDDLLDLSRIESGRFSLNKNLVKPREIIEEAINSLRAQAEQKEISLKMCLPQNLPPIFADPNKLEEVFINLINNAIKFTPPKGKVDVCACQKEDYLEFSVVDNGVGIPKEEINQIFQKFCRVEGFLAGKAEGGTGLGLAITKHIIEAHKGKIWVKSKVGKGSEFIFNLPENAHDLGKKTKFKRKKNG